MKTKLMMMAAVIILMAQCKKEESDPGFSTNTMVLDVHNDIFAWRYFSFHENKEIVVVNFADTIGWDIGVRYESFRTNGGKSGTGQGAVLDMGAVNFDSINITSIMGKTFTSDDSISVLASMSMPPTMVKTPGSALLDAMFQSPQGPPPHTYAPNNHVYVIRTAKGKHVKVVGTSFFNDLGKEGYFNFKFSFLD